MNHEYLIDPSQDLYKVLGVDKDIGLDDLKKRYHRLTLRHHPDRGGDEEILKEINAAYEVIGDPDKRAYYDRMRGEYLAECARPTWDRWADASSGRPEPRAEGFFDNIRNSHLRDFIIDSLFVFQRELLIRVPEMVMENFQEAVQFVYGMWNHLTSSEDPDPAMQKIDFGGFLLSRNDGRMLLDYDDLMKE